MHSLEHTAGSVIRIWKNLWLQPRRLLRLGWRPESLQPVLCRSRCLSSQVPKPTCYWQLGNLTSASLGHLLLSSYWWKCVVQVLDLLYSNMRLVPFPLEQVPHCQMCLCLDQIKSHKNIKIWRRHCRVGAPKWELFTSLDLTGPRVSPTTSSSSRFLSPQLWNNWLTQNAGDGHLHLQHDPLPGRGKHCNCDGLALHHSQVAPFLLAWHQMF